MGCLSFFKEEVSLDNEPRVSCNPQQVEVMDNHSIPEVVIGPAGDMTHEGLRATFNDWQQFERFVESLNSLKNRLEKIHE